jgi:hypothetical protein
VSRTATLFGHSMRHTVYRHAAYCCVSIDCSHRNIVFPFRFCKSQALKCRRSHGAAVVGDSGNKTAQKTRNKDDGEEKCCALGNKYRNVFFFLHNSHTVEALCLERLLGCQSVMLVFATTCCAYCASSNQYTNFGQTVSVRIDVGVNKLSIVLYMCIILSRCTPSVDHEIPSMMPLVMYFFPFPTT